MTVNSTVIRVLTPYSSETARRFGEYMASIFWVAKYVSNLWSAGFLFGLHFDPEGYTFLRNVGPFNPEDGILQHPSCISVKG
jgi:hypothetical protein